MRSRPGISRPNLTHFTMCGVRGAGCAVAAPPGFPEFFSSAMYVSLQSVLQLKILHRRRKFQLAGGQAHRRVAPTSLAGHLQSCDRLLWKGGSFNKTSMSVRPVVAGSPG